MDVEKWEARYQAGDVCQLKPEPLLVRVATKLRPGRALDLACGAGRNALWLAGEGWNVTAVDGSATATSILIQSAKQGNLHVETMVADLTAGEFEIGARAWDLILMSRYLQRNLFPAIKTGLKAGGVFVGVALLAKADEAPSYKYALPGELAKEFAEWEILEYEEIQHVHRATVEIAARVPPQQASE